MRPKLYILATKPSIPSQPHSSEWILDLSIPPATSLTAPSSSSEAEHKKHNILSGLSPKQKDNSSAVEPSVETTKEEIIVPEKHYYFSRLHHTSHVEDRPQNLMLQIFLTSFPTVTNAQSDHGVLLKHFSEALESVHLTSDSSSWLRQALFSLQTSEILPPVSHGLDVTKFMSFANNYLEQHLRDGVSEDSTELKEVNYSRILRENERLRTMLSPNVNGRASINQEDNKHDDVADDEDIWNLPVRGKPAKAEKGWGGFWITHGPEADVSKNASREKEREEPFERRNVYGGLM